MEQQVSDHSPSTPLVLGPYTIVRRIGIGGAGEVFLATAEDGGPVALKVPNAAAWNSQALMLRFLREGRTAAVLEHPGIVPLVAVGTPESPYLAFGYCAGPNLREWLADHAEDLSERTACDWLELLADAVAHAHERGIVHRDIKPSNILLAEDPRGREGHRPLLGDFGLARVQDASEDTTSTGTLMGTPEFMAPEQTRGVHSQLGPAADVWSLGVLLYRLLTGRLPFPGPTWSETLLASLLEEPLPPRRLRPGLSRDLEAICLKCLEKQPRRRYADAAELRDDLRRFRQGQRTVARPLGTMGSGLRWLRLRPSRVMLVLAPLVVVVSGLVGLSLHHRSLQQALGLAERRRHVAETLTARLLERDRSLRRMAHANAMALAGRVARAGNDPQRVRTLLEGWRPAPGEEDYRGFAWRALHHPWTSAARSVRLPTASATALATLPDGRAGLVVGSDGFAAVVSFDTGAVVRQLESEALDLFCAAVSPGGRWGAASGTGMISLWDLSNGRRVAHWRASASPVHSLVFLDDDRLIAGGRERRFHLFRVPDGTPLGGSAEMPGLVVPGTLSPDRTQLSVGLIDERGVPELAVCDLQGRVLLRRAEPEHHVLCGARAPGGGEGVTGGRDGTIRRWREADLGALGVIEAHPAPVQAVCYSPDGGRIASGGGDGSVVVWDARTGEAIHLFRGLDGPVTGLAFAAASRLVGIGIDSRLLIWDLSTRPDALRARELPRSDVLAGAFDPDRERVWLAFADGEAGSWSAGDGRPLRRIPAAGAPVVKPLGARFSPDTGLLAVTRPTGVELIGTADGRPRARWAVPDVSSTLRFDHSGGQLFVAGPSGGWWDLDGQAGPADELPGQHARFPIFGRRSMLFFRPSAVAGGRFEWHDGEAVRSSPSTIDEDFSESHSLSPDGLVAAWGLRTKVALLRGGDYRELPMFGEGPSRTAFSRDGQTLAAATSRSIILFDLATEQEVVTFDRARGPVAWLEFAPGDRLLAAATNGEAGPAVQFWHAPITPGAGSQ